MMARALLLLLPAALAAVGDASAPSLRGLAEAESARCHTAREGEVCYTAVMWAMENGIRLHPEWYPALTPKSSFQAFQDHLHVLQYGECPKPCPMPWEPSCHTAVEGDQCHTAVMWAKQHGIVEHPEWYANLTRGSSFEDFQHHLWALNFDNCPMPCGYVRCHTAEEGEQCYTATFWAKSHGIYERPEWYPALTPKSSFEAFQAHLHRLKYANCTVPCEPEDPTRAEPSTPTRTAPAVKPREGCKLAVDVLTVTAAGNLEHLPGYTVEEGTCHQAEPSSHVYLTSGLVPVTGECSNASLGLVQWYNNSKCSGAPLALTTFTFGNVPVSDCRDILGEVVPGARCRGRPISA